MSQPPLQPTTVQQLPLFHGEQGQAREVLEQEKAREMFLHSRELKSRYGSFEVLMADPVTGRSVRMAAAALVRSALKKTRGR